MVDWPTTLPTERSGSVSEGYVSAYVEDQASVGAPRRRKRFTRTLKKWSFSLTMTDAQAVIMRTFIETTTDGGVTEFNWTHPITLTAYEVRLTSIPQIQHIADNIWQCGVQIGEI